MRRLLLALLLSGCCLTERGRTPMDVALHNPLIESHALYVSAPARFGSIIGTIVGVPVMLACLPITLAIRVCAYFPEGDDRGEPNVMELPHAACALGFSYAFGFLPSLAAPEEVRPVPVDPPDETPAAPLPASISPG